MAPPPAPFRLVEAIRQALAGRPLLLGAEERLSAARARVDQARAGLLPRVEIQGSVTDGPLGAPPLFLGGLAGTPIKKQVGASLNFTQTLLDFGRTHNQVRARRADVTAGAEGLAMEQARVVLEVRTTYLAVLQAQQLRSVNRDLLEQRRLVARQAETFRANGLGTRLDVDLAELNVSQAELALVRAGGDVGSAYAALSAAVGRDVAVETALEDPPPGEVAGAMNVSAEPAPAVPPPTPEALLSEAGRHRPELRQALAQVRAAEHLVSAAKAGNRPFVVGVGSVGRINPSPVAPSDKPWAVGLGITIPVFTGRLVESQVVEGQRNLAALRQQVHEWENQIRRQVISALANLTAADEGVRVALRQLVRAEDALKLGTERYRAQLGSIVELSQTQVAFAVARYDLVRARYEREQARAALDFAVGRLPAGAEERVP